MKKINKYQKIMKNTIKKGILVLFIILIIFSINSIATKDLMGLSGNIIKNGAESIYSNITVKIYKENSSGTPIYDSGNDFSYEIRKDMYNIMLGSKSNELDLDFGEYYYLDLLIDGNDIDFESKERFMFQSKTGSVKNISLNGDDLIITGGNVGIGKATPSYALDISGTLNTNDLECTNCIDGGDIDSSTVQRRVTGTCSSGSAIRTIYSDGSVSCESDSTGGLSCFSCESTFLSEDSSDVWNEYGYAYDLRFEGNSDPNLLYIDGTDNSVGIGTNNPKTILDIGGTMRSTGQTIPSSGSGLEMNYDLNKGSITSINRGTNSFKNLEILGKDIEFTTGTTLYIKSTGDIGIGKSDPNYKLDVTGTIKADFSIISENPNGFRLVNEGASKSILHRMDSLNYWILLANNAYGTWSYTPFRIGLSGESVGIGNEALKTYLGRLGIGNRVPWNYQLEVAGDAAKTSGGTTWASISDKRFKNIINDIDNGMEIISKLKPIKYKWNELYKEKYGNNNDTMYGFTAQNVKEVLPEMVKEDKEGYLWYNPSGYEAVMTKAIQELLKEDKNIRKEICNKDNSYSFC